MSRWAIGGTEFQAVWVNPKTWVAKYESASYLKIEEVNVVHVVLTHDSVPVGVYLEHAPGLTEDQDNAMAIEAVGNFLKSRQRIDFIRLARDYPSGNRHDATELHTIQGLRTWTAIGEKPLRRGETTGLLQPGAFKEPPSAEYAALRGPGLLVTGPEAEEIITRLGGEDPGALERLGGDEPIREFKDTFSGESVVMAYLTGVDEVAAELVTVAQADKAAEFMAEVEALPDRLCDCGNKPAGTMCACDEIARLADAAVFDAVAKFPEVPSETADERQARLARFDTVSAPISEMAQRAVDSAKKQAYAISKAETTKGIILVDDPHAGMTVWNDTDREATVKFFEEQGLARKDAPGVVIMARLHDKDEAGIVDLGGLEVGHLELPKT